MPKNGQRRDDGANEVVKRNVEEARKLLAAKQQRNKARSHEGEPLQDDDLHGDQNMLANEPLNARGATAQQRNLGGSRPQ
jgi:hypothetical protein